YHPIGPTYTLTVTKTGTGTGTVTAPTALNCGTTCSAGYALGAVVTVSQAPGSGSTFTGWSGACTGTGACSVTMSQARTVTAAFANTSDVTPPGNAGSPVVSAPTTGSTTVSYSVTWAAAIDQPSGLPVPTYNWTAGHNDGYGGTSGTVT